MEIFDSHAHYDDEAFDVDRDELLASMPEKGVISIINAGISVKSSLNSIQLANRYPFVYAAAGIHPEEAEHSGPQDVDKIGELASNVKIVAIGEIGLDYHYEIDKEVQLRLFLSQLSLANDLNLPVIIHERDAHADMLDILKKYKPRGVLHCFSGSTEMAVEVVKLGLYIGLTGVVTFKNNKKAASVIAAVPDERVLCETDCPYMTPEPLRGKRCDSTMLEHTLRSIAAYKSITPENAASLTASNARTLFNL